MPGPIFVVAYPHSGTTMLRNALAMCPDVFGIAIETKFFQQLPLVQGSFPSLDDAPARERFVHYVGLLASGTPVALPVTGELERALSDADAREIASATPGDHVALFVATLDHVTKQEGKQVWLEKTPEHLFSIDQIQASLPAARFVEMVRSPLDVLASKKWRQLVAERRRAAGRESRDRFFHPVWDAVTWRAALAAGDRAARATPDAIKRVRYEDLVAAPEATFRGICDWLGVTFTDEMLQVKRSNAAGQAPAAERGVSAASVENWRNVLTPGEIAIVNAIVGKAARAVGYELPRERPDASTLRWLGRTMADPVNRTVTRARRVGWASAARAVWGYVRRTAAR